MWTACGVLPDGMMKGSPIHGKALRVTLLLFSQPHERVTPRGSGSHYGRPDALATCGAWPRQRPCRHTAGRYLSTCQTPQSTRVHFFMSASFRAASRERVAQSRRYSCSQHLSSGGAIASNRPAGPDLWIYAVGRLFAVERREEVIDRHVRHASASRHAGRADVGRDQ